jgi:hypothetical protein
MSDGTGRGRIHQLDAVSGIAALIVAIFWHYQHFVERPIRSTSRSGGSTSAAC